MDSYDAKMRSIYTARKWEMKEQNSNAKDVIHSLEEVIGTLENLINEERNLAASEEYEELMDCWKKVVVMLDADHPVYQKIESAHRKLTEEEKIQVRSYYEDYQAVYEKFLACSADFSQVVKEKRIKNDTTRAIGTAIAAVIMCVLIWGVGWNNFFARLISLGVMIFLAFSIEDIVELKKDIMPFTSGDSDGERWCCAVIAGVVGAVVWWFMIGQPTLKIGFVIGWGLFWGGAVWDKGSGEEEIF
jgi:hypothetical protein